MHEKNELKKIPCYNSLYFKDKERIANLPSNDRILLRGYRSYIGANDPERWYGIGRLQYYFLINQGLKHNSVFLDLGCGALRLGQYLIPYLETRHYFGLEPEKLLVDCGIFYELDKNILNEKKPNFQFNYAFEFPELKSFDYCMANSIFTHLNKEDIKICFEKLILKTNPNSKFFFTFKLGDSKKNKYEKSHANRRWEYKFEEIIPLALGWDLKFIGDWNHPNNQQMVLASPKK